MTAPADDTTTDLHAVIAELRAERDAALAREARRDTDYADRAAYQAATVEVLQALGASPGDPKPVFELIARRAHDLCDAYTASLAQVIDGSIVLGAYVVPDERDAKGHEASFPRPVAADTMFGRAILAREPVQLPDVATDKTYALREGTLRGAVRAQAAVPLMRDGEAIGAINITQRQTGGFSQAQIELLQVFANQAVIAITSAETHRALETRTADLQQALEYQTATSDVLKVISRSTFNLQPVLQAVIETAARLCDSDMAMMFHRDRDGFRMAVNHGYPAELENYWAKMGTFPIDLETPAAGHRAARECRAVHVPDVTAVPDYPEALHRLGGQRTSLSVPLLRDGEAIGVIGLGRRRVQPFTDRQIELVSTFADQAVIAIENTRLLNEQREALEQQTAIAEVLRVINSSPGNLGPVFDAMLEKAMRLCEAAFGYLATYDGEGFHHVGGRGLPPRFADFLRTPTAQEPGSAALSALRGEAFVHITDLLQDEGSRQPAPVRRASIEMGGARTQLIVPLRKDGVFLGMFVIYRQEVRPFTDKQIALLQNFAAQAVIAMENARLLTETREALEQQTATAEVLQVINASPGNLQPVFDIILAKAMQLCGAAFGGLSTWDGNYAHIVAMRGYPPALSEKFAAREPSLEISPAIARLYKTRRPIQVPDVRDGEGYRNNHPDPRALADLGGARTFLAVPLRKDEAMLGHIAIFRQEVRPFSDKQVALLENFAAQAVIAMENARLLTETREALEQQTATAEVLQVINASPGDLVPVFDAMLEKALRLCGAAYGTLYSFDGELFKPIAFRGVGPEFAELMMKYPPTKRPGSPAVRALETKRPIDVPDLMDEENYRSGLPAALGLVEVGGFRAFVNVPLVKDGVVLGLLTIYRQVVGKFSKKQIALLESFAAQAVIAMENARLLNEQREALEQQTATAEVLEVINASPGNLTPVFDAILEKAHSLCGAAFGSLTLYDGTVFRAVATRGYPEQYSALMREPFPPGVGQQALIRGDRLYHIPDMRAVAPAPGVEARRRFFTELGLRTGLVVPLRKDGILLGVISASRQEVRPFSDKEIGLLENFAAQAVVAMENARLLNEVRQRQEELRITFENMGDGVALFDETRHLVASNQRFQHMLDVPDDVIASRPNFSDYIRYLADHGEYGPEPEDHVHQLLALGSRPRTFERTRPNGRIIEIRANPVPGGGFVVIYADITERKRNEEEIRAARDAAEEASRTIEAAYRELKIAQANLIQAEKMASLGQLTAGIAHEIKNPLNFVNNFAALSVDLLGELKDAIAPAEAVLSEKQRAEIDDVSTLLTSNLEKITEHGRRADGIVKAMLEHSRGSSGERRMVDLNALIDEALNLAYHGARAQDQSFNVTLERDFGDGIAPIELAPQDMTRVFLNLFSNGFYAVTRRARSSADAGFMPTLKITTGDLGEAVEIRVRDNGIGIPAEIRDKLFQPFFTTKPTGEGTGLGLSISYDTVTQQHGGSITVESEAGEYSEFTIRLPRTPAL